MTIIFFTVFCLREVPAVVQMDGGVIVVSTSKRTIGWWMVDSSATDLMHQKFVLRGMSATVRICYFVYSFFRRAEIDLGTKFIYFANKIMVKAGLFRGHNGHRV